MNKKQAVIIVTLLALIVCVGVVATKLNSPINYVNGLDNNDSSNSTVSSNSDKSNGTDSGGTQPKDSGSQFFEETRLTRDQKNAETLQTLKNFIDDQNVSQDNKADAEKKYTALAMNANYEMKIESTLKSKGYEDAICSIENDKVRVIVKNKEKLTDKNTREIKDVVMSVCKMEDVEIEVKDN